MFVPGAGASPIVIPRPTTGCTGSHRRHRTCSRATPFALPTPSTSSRRSRTRVSLSRCAGSLMRLSTFSARVETVTTKPFVREAFKRTRCLVPASGYQEWQDGDGIAVRECRQQTSATIDRPRRSGARHLGEDDRLTDAHAALLPQFEASAARICLGFIPHCVTPKLTKV
jgi:hypothetical protein